MYLDFGNKLQKWLFFVGIWILNLILMVISTFLTAFATFKIIFKIYEQVSGVLVRFV